MIAASRNNAIRIPADRVDEFVRAIERHDRQARPLASWQPYTLKPGESLDDVARRGHVTTAELLRANGLSPGRRLLPGTQLIAPQASVKDERQVESFEGPKVYEQVSVPAVYHRVAKRESIASIADAYDVTVAQLRAWNGGAKVAKVGSSLLVRPATTQTLLTGADGSRQVVARAALPSPSAKDEPPPSRGAPIAAAAARGPATAAKVARAPAGKAHGTKPPVAKAATPTVRAVYQPPRAPSARGAARPAHRPRT